MIPWELEVVRSTVMLLRILCLILHYFSLNTHITNALKMKNVSKL